jgi:cytochrome c peroxidase
MTVKRRGEMHFHSADLCFQSWQSCSSCHPSARVDGLNWDLMNDGFGNPKNAKSMLLAHQTPPTMSSGIRATAEDAVRAGIRHIQFAVRPPEDALAIDAYLKALAPVPSPYLVDGKLSGAARRGRKLFFSEKVGCAKCHPEPLYTDLQMHDVASKGPYDRRDEFDTPTLIEVWRTAPYMHDGHYPTMKELLRDGKHGKTGGEIEELTHEELDDLAQFVLSL